MTWKAFFGEYGYVALVPLDWLLYKTSALFRSGIQGHLSWYLISFIESLQRFSMIPTPNTKPLLRKCARHKPNGRSDRMRHHYGCRPMRPSPGTASTCAWHSTRARLSLLIHLQTDVPSAYRTLSHASGSMTCASSLSASGCTRARDARIDVRRNESIPGLGGRSQGLSTSAVLPRCCTFGVIRYHQTT